MRHDFRAKLPLSRSGTLASSGVSKERVAALFDGIVAITATLLILNLDVTASGHELSFGDLRAILPELAHWAVSFVMVGVIWVEFHFVFAHTKHWDSGLLLVTFAQIAAISLVPFAAELVGDHAGSTLATLVFSAVMGTNGLLVAANIYILRRKTHLHVDEATEHRLRRRGHAQALIYAACIPLALIAAMLGDSTVSVLAWIACPLALAIFGQRLPAADTIDQSA
jgi:uncharacterized membrane protein